MTLKKFKASDTRKDRAEQVADFLNDKVVGPDWLIARHGLNDPRKRRRLAAPQEKLKGLLGPALLDLADGRGGSENVEKLVVALSELKGQPYRFERKLVKGRLTDEWERIGSLVLVDAIEDYFLGCIAELFADGTLRLLGCCAHCGRFFVTGGQGKRAKFAPGHASIESNKKLRKAGYFSDNYKKRVRLQLKKARALREKGLRGHRLLEKLEIGKTLLRRHDLWDE